MTMTAVDLGVDVALLDYGESDPLPMLTSVDLNIEFHATVERRSRTEGWTAYDLYAARLQSSLLAYRSHESYAATFAFRSIMNA